MKLHAALLCLLWAAALVSAQAPKTKDYTSAQEASDAAAALAKTVSPAGRLSRACASSRVNPTRQTACAPLESLLHAPALACSRAAGLAWTAARSRRAPAPSGRVRDRTRPCARLRHVHHCA